MLEAILILSSLFFCGTQAHQGYDMDDQDFDLYLQVHENFGERAGQYTESFGRGCVKGAATGAFTGKGFQALCIGCAVGGASETVAEFAFPKNK